MNSAMHKTLRAVCKRSFSTSSGIFDKGIKRQQRNNAALLQDSDQYEYLKNEVARRLVDRLEDIERDLPLALDLGSGSGHILKELNSEEGLGGIQTLIQCDSSERMLLRDVPEGDDPSATVQTKRVIVDDEFLPFPPHHFDAVLSSLHLHWANDPEGTFRQINESLKPDGVFLGAVLGGDSLQELRSAFILADQERQGGITPHISPFLRVADAGSLLVESGFNLTTVDTDLIQVDYPDPFTLMEHLRGMGENNAVADRSSATTTKDSLVAMASIYQSMYGNSDGTIPVTFQVIYMIGWSPHESQQKPLRRGSAQRSMKELAKEESSD